MSAKLLSFPLLLILILSGDEGTRTPDPRLAKAVLSQLSYIPYLGREWA